MSILVLVARNAQGRDERAHLCKKSSPYWFDFINTGGFGESQEFVGLYRLGSASCKIAAVVGTYSNVNVVIGEDESGI